MNKNFKEWEQEPKEGEYHSEGTECAKALSPVWLKKSEQGQFASSVVLKIMENKTGHRGRIREVKKKIDTN